MMKKIWKPLLHRAVTGRWKRFVMERHPVPFPAKMITPGLYLHVPFCKELCPYCPYNREKYTEEKFKAFQQAVLKEIDLYAQNTSQQKYQSFYIGGGTPTLEPYGLNTIIKHVKQAFSFTGDICIELHPAEMEQNCLDALKEIGVTLVSVGVQTTDDTLLKLIGRKHDGQTAMDAVKRAVAAGFDSVNVDLMFALPTQTLEQLNKDLEFILDAGVDQVSTYPIFGFPYTELGEKLGLKAIKRPNGRLIRKMFYLIAENAKTYGLERCAVWSFLKPAKKKFSSITRHHYMGFGPSAASMTGDYFYVNTFSVDEYAKRVTDGLPIALAMKLTKRLEMAYWLYWRVYEMHIPKKEFHEMFQEHFERIFGEIILLPRVLSMARQNSDEYEITESGAYWIHRLQNEYSLNYINRLWGTCRKAPWPGRVVL